MVAKQVDVRIEGLNPLLRALNKFPKEAGAELRDEAQTIASRIMAPAYQRAASTVPHWGAALSASVRAKRVRIPSVSIGYARAAVSGGASSNMLRWPTTSGDKGSSFAPFQRTGWMNEAKGYKADAMEAWGDALTRIVTKWNRGI